MAGSFVLIQFRFWLAIAPFFLGLHMRVKWVFHAILQSTFNNLLIFVKGCPILENYVTVLTGTTTVPGRALLPG